MGAATTKTEWGLSGLTSYTRYVWAYNTYGHSDALAMTASTSNTILCGTDSLFITHLAANGVAPVDKTTVYGTVTNIPGEPSHCWITKNLGADHQANSYDDNTEASAGWYWQFNRKQGYKCHFTTPFPSNAWSASISENSDWSPANDPCTLELGTGWRLPSNIEWMNVVSAGGWSDDRDTWGSDLKLHNAGYIRDNNVHLTGRGLKGIYWSLSQHSDIYAGALYIDYSDVDGNSPSGKAAGCSVRCVKE